MLTPQQNRTRHLCTAAGQGQADSLLPAPKFPTFNRRLTQTRSVMSCTTTISQRQRPARSTNLQTLCQPWPSMPPSTDRILPCLPSRPSFRLRANTSQPAYQQANNNQHCAGEYHVTTRCMLLEKGALKHVRPGSSGMLGRRGGGGRYSPSLG